MSEVIRLPLYGQLRESVSYSEVRLFNDCQWKWYLRHVAGLYLPERSLQMSFGTTIHKVLESAFSPVIVHSLQELDGIFAAEFDKNMEGLELLPHEVEERERLRGLGPQIIRDSLACPDLQNVVPLKNELRIFEPISRNDGLDIRFKGYVDFIFMKKLTRKKVIFIADFKTCTWGWTPQKVQDPATWAQLVLYKHYFCKLTGANPRDISTAFILLKKTPREEDSSVQVVRVGAGPKALQQALDYMQSTITAMHSGRYEKNRKNCIYQWVDRITKEPRSATCPFYQSENCPGSIETTAVS